MNSLIRNLGYLIVVFIIISFYSCKKNNLRLHQQNLYGYWQHTPAVSDDIHQIDFVVLTPRVYLFNAFEIIEFEFNTTENNYFEVLRYPYKLLNENILEAQKPDLHYANTQTNHHIDMPTENTLIIQNFQLTAKQVIPQYPGDVSLYADLILHRRPPLK